MFRIFACQLLLKKVKQTITETNTDYIRLIVSDHILMEISEIAKQLVVLSFCFDVINIYKKSQIVTCIILVMIQ